MRYINIRGQTWNQHAEQLRSAAEAPIQLSDEGSLASNKYTRPRRNIKELERLTYDQLGNPN